MQDLIDEFYEVQKGSFGSSLFPIGRICDAPIPIPIEKNPMPTIEFVYNTATMTDIPQLVHATWDRFGTAHNHNPVKCIDLQSHERAVVIRCKLRPVVILSSAPDASETTRRHSEAYIVAPVYSFMGNRTKPEYPDEFISLVKAFAYNCHFYLPPHGVPHFDEGFARFDRLYVVAKEWLRGRTVALSPEAVECMQAWFALFIARELTDFKCSESLATRCLSRSAQFMLDYQALKHDELGLTVR